jgi:divalent metal cation (Fe/Co/Zn/Cd) transporter
MGVGRSVGVELGDGLGALVVGISVGREVGAMLGSNVGVLVGAAVIFLKHVNCECPSVTDFTDVGWTG